MPIPRKSRLDLRMTPEVLALLKRAAEIEGRSLTEFVVAAASAAAQQTIEQTEIIRLSGESARRFVEHLLDPPPIAPAMVRAFEHHKRLFGSPL